MRWLSPADIQMTFGIKRTTAFNLLKRFEQSGGEVLKIGKFRRVEETQFTEFLRKTSHERNH